MVNVKHEGEYNAELNIVFCKFINTPKSPEDIEFIARENERWYRKGGQHKVWNITDISELGMANVKIVKAYHQRDKPIADKYIIDYCVVCSKPIQRVTAQLFNIFRRENHPVFSTREEAIEWVKKRQETIGRFVPI